MIKHFMPTNRRFYLLLGDYFKHFVLIGTLTAIGYLPLLRTHRMTWDSDTWFHLMRIREINATLQAQQLPNLVNMNSFGDVGQAIAGAYPSWTLIPFVWLTKNLSPVTQWYAIGGLIMIISSVVMYAILTQLMQTRWWCQLGAITYAFSTMSVGFVTNGNLGMELGLVFLPLVAYGLIQALNPEKNQADLLIGSGVGLLLLTHLMSAFLSALFVVAVAGYCVFKRRERLIVFIKAGIIASLIGLPTLVLNIMLAGQMMSPSWFDLANHTLNVSDLLSLSGLLGLKYAYWNISLLSIMMLTVALAHFRKLSHEKVLVGVAVVFLLLATDAFPWVLLKDSAVAVIQFPARLVVFPFVVIFIVAMVAMEKQLQRHQMLKGLMIGLFGITLVAPLVQIEESYDKLTTYPRYATTGYTSRSTTVLDAASFKSPSFNDTRAYIDYMPSQMALYAVKLSNQHIGSSASNAMVDVVKYHSVRPLDYTLEAMSALNSYGSYRTVPQHVKQQNQTSQFHHLSADMTQIATNVSRAGLYELPFWGYKGLNYTMMVNGQRVKPQISSHGRLIAQLNSGQNKVTIQAKWPVPYAMSVIVAVLTLATILIYAICYAMYPTRKLSGNRQPTFA